MDNYLQCPGSMWSPHTSEISKNGQQEKQKSEHPRVLCIQPSVERVALEIKLAMASRKSVVCLAQQDERAEVLGAIEVC